MLGLYINYLLLKKYEAGYIGAIIGPLVVLTTMWINIILWRNQYLQIKY